MTEPEYWRTVLGTLYQIKAVLLRTEHNMALDTSKVTAAVTAISADVDQVVALVTTAKGQTAADEAAAQQSINDAVAALDTAKSKLAALLPPPQPNAA